MEASDEQPSAVDEVDPEPKITVIHEGRFDGGSSVPSRPQWSDPGRAELQVPAAPEGCEYWLRMSVWEKAAVSGGRLQFVQGPFEAGSAQLELPGDAAADAGVIDTRLIAVDDDGTHCDERALPPLLWTREGGRTEFFLLSDLDDEEQDAILIDATAPIEWHPPGANALGGAR